MGNTPIVIVHTQSHNSIKTIHRSVDSILNQSYDDFIYYLVDNGSIDGTREVIAEYANRDSRIMPLYFPPNGDDSPVASNVLWTTWEQIFSDSLGDYYCMLDADDEYAPDFLEKTLDFIAVNNLDIAACGSQFIEEETGEVMNMSYSIQNDWILQKKDFKNHFDIYLQFMWTIWGKLYSMALVRKHSGEQYKEVTVGTDTIFATRAFGHAKRVGILGTTLHKYYRSSYTTMNKFDDI